MNSHNFVRFDTEHGLLSTSKEKKDGLDGCAHHLKQPLWALFFFFPLFSQEVWFEFLIYSGQVQIFLLKQNK